ncbi:hypothetical protein [Methanococcoides sp. FTZ1]|uniref:hypothetical protein n=1 Tax=Methanococcoides sp. FTZ1 TaxID=3439061 RepID=UPI003F82C42B
MGDSIIVEIAQFRLGTGVSDGAFLDEAKKVQEHFLEKQGGYIDRELLKDEDGLWMDILHWCSMEEAQRASEAMMSDPSTQGFIQMIDLSSVNMLHLVQLSSWK